MVQLAGDAGVLEQRFQFRSKYDVAAGLPNVQRFDTHTVARQHQPLPGFRPDGERKHAAKPFKAVCVPFEERPESHFRIALGPEPMAAGFQFAPKFAKVIDFAVIDNGGTAVFCGERLVTADQVDNLQTNGTERNVRRPVTPLLIWSAVRDGRRHRMHNGLVRTPGAMRKARDTTHLYSPSPRIPIRSPRFSLEIQETIAFPPCAKASLCPTCERSTDEPGHHQSLDKDGTVVFLTGALRFSRRAATFAIFMTERGISERPPTPLRAGSM